MKTLITIALTSLFAGQALAQCTKDTDCKGDRICDKGACMSPGAAPQRTFNLPNALNQDTRTFNLPNALNQEPPSPKFEEFPAQRHPGPWVPPKGFRRVSVNEWRNEFGKLVEPPAMNFAGRYHIALNSCGTGCRYYSLTDLATGKDLALLAPFASAEPPPKTKEGYTYTTDLISRPNCVFQRSWTPISV
jgi:hypothetical protein